MKIAVVGSGIAGLVAAHGLRRRDHDVTLFSDRSADDWLHRSAPTGVAGRFHQACELERELGMHHWDAETPGVQGVHVTLSLSAKNQVLTLAAQIKNEGQAIDMRMQLHRWMNDLEAIGGKVVIEKIDPARLDAIAQAHDLTLVGVGRGPLCEVFPRHADMSLRQTPARELAFAIVRGPGEVPGVPFRPVKFNISPDEGEAFWNPYLHKDGGLTWGLLVEGIPGKGFDVFRDCKDGHEVTRRMKKLITERMPWEAEWIKNAELADERGWLVGRVLPSVRGPVAQLPSGAVAMAIGDTLMSVDPCAGQGANNGSRWLRYVFAAVEKGGPFDAAWMESTFRSFYEDSGKATFLFSDVMTRPVAKASRDLFTAAYGSTGTADSPAQRVADGIANNFLDPRQLTDAFLDRDKAHAFIAEKIGGSAKWHLFKQTLAIGKQQILQRLGLPARHPVSG